MGIYFSLLYSIKHLGGLEISVCNEQHFIAISSSSIIKSPLGVKAIAIGKCQNFKGHERYRSQIHNQDFNTLAPTKNFFKC